MNFSINDRDRLLGYYREHINKFGINTFGGVSWSSKQNQEVRFRVLSEIGDLNNSSVLDVGCGFGSFYKFLSTRFSGISYTGIDIVPEMINTCRQNFPGVSFLEGDISQVNLNKFDFVFASGTLSFKVENYKQIYFDMIRKMYDLSTIGTGFNLLLAEHHIDDHEFATYTIEEIKKYCSTISNRMVIRQDYLPYDFTVYLYHN